MPIACLAIAALVASRRCLCVESTQSHGRAGRSWRRSWSRWSSSCSRSTCACRCSAPSPPTARTPPTRRSAATAACSSCPCSGPTSTSARSPWPTRGSRRASGRWATRRRRRRPPTGSPGGSGRSRAAAARSPPTSGSASSSCTAASTSRAASSPPAAPTRAEAALRRDGLAAARARRRDLELAAALRASPVGYGQATMAPTETDYLEAILNANVYDVAVETPLQEAPLLSAAPRQPAASEARGPAARLLVQAPRRLQQDVAPVRRPSCGAASSPRRPATTRRASRSRRSGSGTAATIVMPVTTPQIKVDSVAALGATVVLEGDSYDDAYAEAMRIGAAPEAHVRPPLRRPRRDRRPGHDRDGDPAPAAASRSTRSSSPSAAAG